MDKEENLNIGIITNIWYSLKSSEKFFEALSKDVNDIESFKLLVLSLDNVIELLFKFIISNREEMLLYIDEDFKKVMKKYEEAYQNEHLRLDTYFLSNPLANNLHTISMTKASEMLCYRFRLISENELEKCNRLNRIRNGLAHHSVAIRYVDIATFLVLFEKCCKLYNEEMKEYSNIIMMLLLDDYNLYRQYDSKQDTLDLLKIFYNKCIYDYVLENSTCMAIIGSVLDNYNNVYIDVDSMDYEKVRDIFLKRFEKKSEEYKNFKENFADAYSLLLDSDIIYEDLTIYDELNTIFVNLHFLEKIRNVWSEEQQRNKMYCKTTANEIIKSQEDELNSLWGESLYEAIEKNREEELVILNNTDEE